MTALDLLKLAIEGGHRPPTNGSLLLGARHATALWVRLGT